MWAALCTNDSTFLYLPSGSSQMLRRNAEPSCSSVDFLGNQWLCLCFELTQGQEGQMEVKTQCLHAVCYVKAGSPYFSLPSDFTQYVEKYPFCEKKKNPESRQYLTGEMKKENVADTWFKIYRCHNNPTLNLCWLSFVHCCMMIFIFWCWSSPLVSLFVFTYVLYLLFDIWTLFVPV